MLKTFTWQINYKKTLDVPEGEDSFEWFVENEIWAKETDSNNNDAETEFNPNELYIDGEEE